MGEYPPGMPLVEYTARYATTVADLSSAWAFVMEYLDRVGPDPQIQISPVWTLRDDGDDVYSPRRFEVVVSGTVEKS